MPLPRRVREIPLTIAERLNDRLTMARADFDRRYNSVPPNRRASAPLLPSLAANDPELIAARERSVLRIVFRELGESHRQYRYRTGKEGTPELRAAAHAFKATPSAQSLLPVATMLDELKLLAW